jgi:hypothetical protein
MPPSSTSVRFRPQFNTFSTKNQFPFLGHRLPRQKPLSPWLTAFALKASFRWIGTAQTPCVAGFSSRQLLVDRMAPDMKTKY